MIASLTAPRKVRCNTPNATIAEHREARCIYSAAIWNSVLAASGKSFPVTASSTNDLESHRSNDRTLERPEGPRFLSPTQRVGSPANAKLRPEGTRSGHIGAPKSTTKLCAVSPPFRAQKMLWKPFPARWTGLRNFGPLGLRLARFESVGWRQRFVSGTLPSESDVPTLSQMEPASGRCPRSHKRSTVFATHRDEILTRMLDYIRANVDSILCSEQISAEIVSPMPVDLP